MCCAPERQAAMFRSVEEGLRRLDTDYLDMLWVHAPELVTPIEEILRAYDDLASSGKILYAGFSNFPASMTSRAASRWWTCGGHRSPHAQFEYSLVERSGNRENLPMAGASASVRRVVTAGGGLLTGNTEQHGRQANPLEAVGARRGRSGGGGDHRRHAGRGEGPASPLRGSPWVAADAQEIADGRGGRHRVPRTVEPLDVLTRLARRR